MPTGAPRASLRDQPCRHRTRQPWISTGSRSARVETPRPLQRPRLRGHRGRAPAAAQGATSTTQPLSWSSRTVIASRSSWRRRRTLTSRVGAWSPPARSAAATPACCACSATRYAAGEAERFRISPLRSAGLSGSQPTRGARRLLDLVATVPTPVWGRDELDAGEMWNSNSVGRVADRHRRPLDTTGSPRHRAAALRAGTPASKSPGAAVPTSANTPRLCRSR